MTVYSNNIPQPTDRPADSQAELLNNFQALKVFVDRNHVNIVDPTTNTSEGKHKFVQMPNQGSAPTTNGTEGAVYVKSAGGRSALFWRQQSNGTEVQMTNRVPQLSTDGYTFLPGGLLLQWGRVTATTTTTNISFPVTFTTVYQVVATFQTSGTGFLNKKWNTSAPNNSGFQFNVEGTTATGQCAWYAIGLGG